LLGVVGVVVDGLPLIETGAMGEQMPDGDHAFAGPPRVAGECRLVVPKIRQVRSQRRIEVELARIDKQHDGEGGRHDLGHGGEIEDGVGRHWPRIGEAPDRRRARFAGGRSAVLSVVVLVDLGPAVRLLENDSAVARDEQHGPGNSPIRDPFGNDGVGALELLRAGRHMGRERSSNGGQKNDRQL